MLFVIFPLLLCHLITMCLSLFLLEFSLYGTLCTSWTWVAISFPMLGKFSTIISSNIFSGPYSLSSPSETPKMPMLLCLMLSQRSLRLSSFLFILFSFFLSFFLFWLCWIFAVLHGLSLVAASRGYSLLQCEASHCGGYSGYGAWVLGVWTSVVVACGL